MFRKLFVLWVLLFTSLQALPVLASETFGNRPDVRTFIKTMVKKHKFNEQELITLFDQVKVRPQVMKSIKAPLEENPWHRYQMLFVTEWRIREGVAFWKKYKDILDRAEKTYGVPASIIVATIGVETKYGMNNGTYPVIDALSNIAFSGSSRANYFRSELEQFLLLTREKHLNPLKVYGSYAGAIGQPQFMPSSYRSYAVNFSGSGKIDLSNNEADIIGSIANYYKQHGWTTNQPVAIPAAISGYRFSRFVKNSTAIPVSSLANYGVYPRGYAEDNLKAKLIELKGYYRNEYWLGFHNFDVIKRYNTSTLYAMAVFQLSEYIASVRGRLQNG
jgi:membrane-bound lytic murein transglycosylase B